MTLLESELVSMLCFKGSILDMCAGTLALTKSVYKRYMEVKCFVRDV